MDFDDLLLLVVRLLAEIPEVLAWYRGLWRYVLVDEYQDTNRAQYRIIQLLTGEHRNVCVVGDSDQSIYKWRGADIRNILDFEEDFPGTKVVRLEQNYRSTQSILALAAGVIANNVRRKDKTLWTENAAGAPARLYRAWDEQEEAGFVAQSHPRAARRGRARGTTWPSSTGPTPSRACWRMRCVARPHPLRDRRRRALLRAQRGQGRPGLPAARRSIRPTTWPSGARSELRRAGSAPTTLARLDEEAAPSARPLLALAAEPPADVRGKAGRTLQEFAALIGAPGRSSARDLAPPAFIDLVLEQTGYRDALKQERSPEAEARLENLEELIAAAEDYTTPRPSRRSRASWTAWPS